MLFKSRFVELLDSGTNPTPLTSAGGFGLCLFCNIFKFRFIEAVSQRLAKSRLRRLHPKGTSSLCSGAPCMAPAGAQPLTMRARCGNCRYLIRSVSWLPAIVNHVIARSEATWQSLVYKYLGCIREIATLAAQARNDRCCSIHLQIPIYRAICRTMIISTAP